MAIEHPPGTGSFGFEPDPLAKDLYARLGLHSYATKRDIEIAFRALSLKYHPDTNGNGKKTEPEMKAISDAYSELRNSKKREVYDSRLAPDPNRDILRRQREVAQKRHKDAEDARKDAHKAKKKSQSDTDEQRARDAAAQMGDEKATEPEPPEPIFGQDEGTRAERMNNLDKAVAEIIKLQQESEAAGSVGEGLASLSAEERAAAESVGAGVNAMGAREKAAAAAVGEGVYGFGTSESEQAAAESVAAGLSGMGAAQKEEQAAAQAMGEGLAGFGRNMKEEQDAAEAIGEGLNAFGGSQERTGRFKRSWEWMKKRGAEFGDAIKEQGVGIAGDLKAVGKGLLWVGRHPFKSLQLGAHGALTGIERTAAYSKYFVDSNNSLDAKLAKLRADSAALVEGYNKLDFRYKMYVTGALIGGAAVTGAVGLSGTAFALTKAMYGQRILAGAGFGLNRSKDSYIADKSVAARTIYGAVMGTAYGLGGMAAGGWVTHKLTDWVGHVLGHHATPAAGAAAQHAPTQGGATQPGATPEESLQSFSFDNSGTLQPDVQSGFHSAAFAADAHATSAGAEAAAAMSSAAPTEAMPSVSVHAGRGYEDMAERLWARIHDPAQSFKLPAGTSPDSDLARLAGAANKHDALRLVHKLAAEHGFFEKTAASVAINPDAHLTFGADGQLHLADPTHADIVQAPADMHTTPALHEVRTRLGLRPHHLTTKELNLQQLAKGNASDAATAAWHAQYGHASPESSPIGAHSVPHSSGPEVVPLRDMGDITSYPATPGAEAAVPSPDIPVTGFAHLAAPETIIAHPAMSVSDALYSNSALPSEAHHYLIDQIQKTGLGPHSNETLQEYLTRVAQAPHSGTGTHVFSDAAGRPAVLGGDFDAQRAIAYEHLRSAAPGTRVLMPSIDGKSTALGWIDGQGYYHDEVMAADGTPMGDAMHGRGFFARLFGSRPDLAPPLDPKTLSPLN